MEIHLRKSACQGHQLLKLLDLMKVILILHLHRRVVNLGQPSGSPAEHLRMMELSSVGDLDQFPIKAPILKLSFDAVLTITWLSLLRLRIQSALKSAARQSTLATQATTANRSSGTLQSTPPLARLSQLLPLNPNKKRFPLPKNPVNAPPPLLPLPRHSQYSPRA